MKEAEKERNLTFWYSMVIVFLLAEILFFGWLSLHFR